MITHYAGLETFKKTLFLSAIFHFDVLSHYLLSQEKLFLMLDREEISEIPGTDSGTEATTMFWATPQTV